MVLSALEQTIMITRDMIANENQREATIKDAGTTLEHLISLPYSEAVRVAVEAAMAYYEYIQFEQGMRLCEQPR